MMTFTLSKLIYPIICSVLSYVYAKTVKSNRDKIDIVPEYYIVGGLLFGPFALAWCWNKKRLFEKYNTRYKKKSN